MRVGAFNQINNIDTKDRDLRIFSDEGSDAELDIELDTNIDGELKVTGDITAYAS